MNDLISRREALDALNQMNLTDADFGYICGAQDAVEIIEQLPSAQPEHTCVTCGRTVNNGGWYEDGRTRCPIEEHYALPKDGHCHLWEKTKVDEDEYPERGKE